MAPKKKKEEPPPVIEAPPPPPRSQNPIYDIKVKNISGDDFSMRKYENKVLIIVNVASMGTLTEQNYTELVELYSKYRDRDLEILAFPCNQFGNKEPNSVDVVRAWVTRRWPGAGFPFFAKVNVHTSPLFNYLKSQKGGGGVLGNNIKWNFAKFLVDKVGNVVGRYAPSTPPSLIEKDLEALVSPPKPPTPPPEPEPDPKKKKR